MEELAEKADFTVERIHEVEAETNHDVIAFVSTVAEAEPGAVARYSTSGSPVPMYWIRRGPCS